MGETKRFFSDSTLQISVILSMLRMRSFDRNQGQLTKNGNCSRLPQELWLKGFDIVPRNSETKRWTRGGERSRL